MVPPHVAQIVKAIIYILAFHAEFHTSFFISGIIQYLLLGMGKTKRSEGLRRGGFGIVGNLMRKFLKISLLRPKAVKHGHFVVIATEGWKPERFVIELGHLNNPDFVKLLKQAEDEFGFSQVGALAIPCEPDELQRIIGRQRQ